MENISKYIITFLLIVGWVLAGYFIFYADSEADKTASELRMLKLRERDAERLFDNEALKNEYYRGFLDGARWRDSNRGADIDSLRKTMNLPKRKHLLKIY